VLSVPPNTQGAGSPTASQLNATLAASSVQQTADALEASKSAARSAKTAAIASIIAALIAVGGVIWSSQESSEASERAARMAADTAVKTVNTQLSGETERSRAEFLRGQQQVIYSKAIEAEQVLTTTEIQQVVAIRDYELSGWRNPGYKKLEEDYTRWHNYGASIYIIGSTEVGDAFNKQDEHHYQFLEAAATAIHQIPCARDPKSSKSDRKACRVRVVAMQSKMDELIEFAFPEDKGNFLKYARRDMGQ
jgi:hypothetical protein